MAKKKKRESSESFVCLTYSMLRLYLTFKWQIEKKTSVKAHESLLFKVYLYE